MDQQYSVDASKFRSILNNFRYTNHVKRATQYSEQSLDLVIDFIKNSIVGSVNVEPQHTFSDL